MKELKCICPPCTEERRVTRLSRIAWSPAILALLVLIFVLGWNARRIAVPESRACACWCDEPKPMPMMKTAPERTWPDKGLKGHR